MPTRASYIKPTFLSLVRAQEGKVMYKNKVEAKQVLDPRVAYVMTNMLEEVLRSGTAAGVRAKYGLNVPMAGKTGTSRDGWFAGYTSELLCIVWVGFDDGRDLDLEGAHSAAPIWAEFMKQALGYREYRDVKPFVAPDGIVSIEIDPMSGMPATPSCPKTYREVYVAGTEPVGSCPLHGGRGLVTNVAGWDTATPAAAGSDTAPRIGGSSTEGPPPASMARRAARQAPPDSTVAASHRRRSPRRIRNPRRRRGYSIGSLVCLNRTQGGYMVFRPLALVFIQPVSDPLFYSHKAPAPRAKQQCASGWHSNGSAGPTARAQTRIIG